MIIQEETRQEPRLGSDVIGFGVGGFVYLLNVCEKNLLIRRDSDSWTTGILNFDTDEVAETEGLDDAGLLKAMEEPRG
ncbi:MAG TPA: hypothetical protein VJS86_08100 [Arthrobacter sp.]|nr:hypothetical protein [Arthrobacter sp.]